MVKLITIMSWPARENGTIWRKSVWNTRRATYLQKPQEPDGQEIQITGEFLGQDTGPHLIFENSVLSSKNSLL